MGYWAEVAQIEERNHASDARLSPEKRRALADWLEEASMSAPLVEDAAARVVARIARLRGE